MTRVLRAAVVWGLMAACVGGDESAADASTIRVRSKDGIGTYLVDTNGRALYSFSGDADGQSACLTNCATVWLPVKAATLPTVGEPAIDARKLGVLTRPDSSSQLTYNRIPLYYYDADAKPGETRGHNAMGFGGRFSLVSPAGSPVPAPR